MSLIFEANGHNAAHISGTSDYLHVPLAEKIMVFAGLVRQIDWSYIILIILCIASAEWTYYKGRVHDDVDKQYHKIISECFGALLLLLIFLFFLCAKVSPVYAGQVQCMYGIFFYLLIMIAVSGTYILCKTALALKLLPLVFVMFLVIGSNGYSPFCESNTFNKPPQECMAVSRDLISQVRAAEEKGMKTMVLNVPKGDGDFNWPHPRGFFGKHFAHTLYSHGLIKHQLQIEVRVNPELNHQYYK